MLRFTTASVGVVDADDELVSGSTSWEAALENATPRWGLRGTWMEGTPAEMSGLARSDMPLVTWLDDGLQEGWFVLAGRRFGRVFGWSSSPVLRPRWMKARELTTIVGQEPRRWMRLEAALPASALGRRADEESPSPLQRLGRLLQLERRSLGIVGVYAVAVGILALATPLAIQVLINWLAFGALYQPVVVLSIGLVVCLLCATALRATQRYAVEILQRRIFVRTVTDLGARLSRVRVNSLDGRYGPELVNRFFDVLTLQKATKILLIDGFTAALQAGVGLLLLALYHPYLLVLDVVIVGLAALALLPLASRGERTAIRESKLKYEVAGWMEELARHPLAFKLGPGDGGEGRLEKLNREYLDARAAHFRVFFGQYLGMQVVQVVVQVGLLLTCGWLVLEGQLTLGQLVAAEFIVASALGGLGKFTEKMEVVYDLLAGVDKLGTLLDLPPERASGVAVPVNEKGAAITARAASFRWPRGTMVFDKLDIDIPAGTTLAIVGSTGSGKSVLADLFAGLRQPTSGSMLRDGVPLDRHLLEPVFGDTLVLRRGGLFRSSVLDNLTLGLSVDEQRLWDVLRDLGLDEVVEALPEGLETCLSSVGAPLSASQSDRLLLARGIVLAPRLLIVDSLLDGVFGRARVKIVNQLRTLGPDTTVVVLTDDPGVANPFDRIFEIRGGGAHARPRLTTA